VGEEEQWESHKIT